MNVEDPYQEFQMKNNTIQETYIKQDSNLKITTREGFQCLESNSSSEGDNYYHPTQGRRGLIQEDTILVMKSLNIK